MKFNSLKVVNLIRSLPLLDSDEQNSIGALAQADASQYEGEWFADKYTFLLKLVG